MIPGVAVTLTSDSGTDKFDGVTSETLTTGPDGTVTAVVTDTKAETVKVTAETAKLKPVYGSPASITFVAGKDVPGPVTCPDPGKAGSHVSVAPDRVPADAKSISMATALVTDQYCNPVPGIEVTFSIPSTAKSVLTVTKGTTGADGVATATLSDGNVEAVPVSATIEDPMMLAGGPATVTFYDVTPPDAPTIEVANATTTAGTAEPGSTVTVTWPNGTTTKDVPTDPVTGAWTTPTPAGMPSGEVSATAKDPAGNVSDPTTAPLDTQVPGAPVIETANATTIGGTEPAPVDPDTKVTVTYPTATGPKTVTTEVNPDGTWSVPTPKDAVSGPVSAVATDPAGNVSQPGTADLDVTPPAAPIITTGNKSTIAGTEPAPVDPDTKVTVTYPTATGPKTVTADVNPDGTWSVGTPTDAISGPLSAVATDPAGNVSRPGVGPLDVDVPAAPVITTGNKSTIAGTEPAPVDPGTKVTVTYPTATGPKTVTTTVKPDGTWSVSTPTDAVNGPLSAVATDPALNVSQPGVGTLDVVAPDAPVITTANGKTTAGTAEPGANVLVTWPDGTTSGPVKADSTTGAWSVTTPSTMPSGTVSATATDPAGNTSKPGTAHLDTDPVGAPVFTTANATTTAGHAAAPLKPGSTLTITWPDGTVTKGIEVKDDGTFTTTTPTGMKSGNIKGVVTDRAGNDSPEGTAYLDTQVPGAPVITTANKDKIAGTEPAPVDNPTTITITYPTASGPKTVTTEVKPDGTWSVDTPTDAISGPIQAKATDPHDNTSPTTTAKLDVDVPAAPEITTANAQTIAGTEPAPVDEDTTITITYPTANGENTVTAKVNPDGTWSVGTPTDAISGPIYAVATDPAGNVSPESTHDLDVVVPETPVIAVANGTMIGGVEPGPVDPGTKITVTYPVAGGGTKTVTTDVNPNGTWSVQTPEDAVNGPLTVKATDPAGNVSPEAKATLDTVAPDAPRIDVANATEVAGKPGSAEPGSTITVTFPDDTVQKTYVRDDGSWSISTPKGMPSGEIKATATDPAGNTSKPSTADLDTVAPDAPVIKTADGDEVSGTAEPGSTVTVTFPDGTVKKTVVDGDGAWSIPTPKGMPNGTVTATATDPAGNVSAPATAQLVRVIVPAGGAALPASGLAGVAGMLVLTG
ncbi:MAG: Ig-like domain-containing protein, partial [Actinomycetia bacterium]|nr:Ig-like domain-containing protein [Actinomycetes bacterium]